ncbi:hypothetical protein [Spiroplasma endosymbiont of Apeira syringaria]|uniref:hypothetical protein n=1 Tax=Spiroplasma endosymbiont of Apeira syringaria TaxID=3066307 RepID=UPI0030CD7C54
MNSFSFIIPSTSTCGEKSVKEYKIGMYDSEALLKRLGGKNNEKWAKSWKKHLKKQK